MNTKPLINIVWMKRDLRLQDHEPLHRALQTKLPCLLIFVFEPSLIANPHYSSRHWNFIKESINDLNKQLETYNSYVLCCHEEVIGALKKLQQFWKISHIYSHQETGIKATYDRDKAVKRFCKNNLITWEECITNGVQRGLKNREHWIAHWEHFMSSPKWQFAPEPKQLIPYNKLDQISNYFNTISLTTPQNTSFQKGGTQMGYKYLSSFFEKRYQNYNKHISKPSLSRKSCSRLSPYIAWGNLSVREIWQHAKYIREKQSHKRAIDGFTSRLRWQAHFIQKFEMEDSMEYYSVNKGYRKLKKNICEAYDEAWVNGKTGFPIVDACMRCLNTTGYLNFRMRALVVSFYTHHLWQPWQRASQHLSRMFLDFEPGIHFPQLQMQAGETGVNMLRIYNPIKNSKEHDPEGIFIRKWIPELTNIPDAYIHEPYSMPPLEQKFLELNFSENYPQPIITIEKTRKKASDILWSMKDDPEVIQESLRILTKHILHRNDNN